MQRQRGSATWLLTQHLLAQAGLPPDALQPQIRPQIRPELGTVRTEDSHSAVAAAVASGLADAGIGLEAAAHAFGLAFVPLARDDYFLVCLAQALEQPAVLALRRALNHESWRQAVTALPGYAVAQPGQVLSLTKALPWWHFRSKRSVK